MMAEVCKLFDITKLKTSPDKPSTNQVERFHKTTNATLAKTVSEAQRDWDDQLPFVLAAYRAMKHNSTGFIPNRFVLGREVLAPIDVVYGSIDDEDQWRRAVRRPIYGHPNTIFTDSWDPAISEVSTEEGTHRQAEELCRKSTAGSEKS